MNRALVLLSVVAGASVLSLAVLAAPAPPEDIAAGRSIAIRNCGECHAVDVGSPGRMPGAPPFAALYKTFPPEHLAEALEKGWLADLPHMKAFDLGPDERAALAAYVISLQPHPLKKQSAQLCKP
jgi:mono/diheme cytochrome c family protein